MPNAEAYIQANVIPNGRTVEIESAGYDEMAAAFGLSKKKRSVEIKRFELSRARQYLVKCFRRLYRLARRGDGARFWRTASRMAAKSGALRFRALHKVVPRWYKEYNARYITTELRIFSAILRTRTTNYTYNRAWIPKPSGGKRPLAVAPVHWRLVANTWQTFLTLWVLGRGIAPWLPGALPGRSCLTAWKEILTRKLHKQPFIYEFDLTKCFDLVRVDKVEKALSAKGARP
jgi:hypothetical protein